MKSVDDFMGSLSESVPPVGLSVALQGLWYCAKGDWDMAHRLVQDDDSADAAWIHGYLHRIEGDLSNARYWYTRARRPVPNMPLEMERTAITRTLIGLNGKAVQATR